MKAFSAGRLQCCVHQRAPSSSSSILLMLMQWRALHGRSKGTMTKSNFESEKYVRGMKWGSSLPTGDETGQIAHRQYVYFSHPLNQDYVSPVTRSSWGYVVGNLSHFLESVKPEPNGINPLPLDQVRPVFRYELHQNIVLLQESVHRADLSQIAKLLGIFTALQFPLRIATTASLSPNNGRKRGSEREEMSAKEKMDSKFSWTDDPLVRKDLDEDVAELLLAALKRVEGILIAEQQQSSCKSVVMSARETALRARHFSAIGRALKENRIELDRVAFCNVLRMIDEATTMAAVAVGVTTAQEEDPPAARISP